MSCLNATFTLTPKSPSFQQSIPSLYGELVCYGADFFPYPSYNLAGCYTADSFYFAYSTSADPGVDYSQWVNRKKARFIELSLYMTSAAPKELALIFGFQSLAQQGRVLIYDNAGLISDQTLQYGDNQFLLEIESLDASIYLYFIHAAGPWFFKGISGYLV